MTRRAPETTAGPPERRLRPLALAVAATVTASLPPFLVGGTGVELGSDLGVSVQELGATVSAYFAASALCSSAMGRLSHRIGSRRSLLFSCALSGVAMLGIFLAAHSFATLVPWLALAGAANALTQPSVNALLSDGVGERHLGAALGVKQASIPLAALLSGAAVPLLVLTVGWRDGFAVGAALAFAVCATIAVAMAPAPERTGPEGRPTMSRRMLAAMGAAGGLGSVAGNALGAFAVSSAVASGVGQGEAGVLLAGGSALCVVVRVTVGRWVDRRGSDGLELMAALLLVGTIGFAGLASGSEQLLVGATVVAFAAGWGWPGLFQFTIVVHNPRAPALATGITQTGTYIGASLGPLLFGIIAGHSYTVAWAMVIAVMLAATAIVARCRVAIGETSAPGRP